MAYALVFQETVVMAKKSEIIVFEINSPKHGFLDLGMVACFIMP